MVALEPVVDSDPATIRKTLEDAALGIGWDGRDARVRLDNL